MHYSTGERKATAPERDARRDDADSATLSQVIE
jgi:hypothetical protein